jgi:Uma2 family endonuclease
LSNPSRAPLGCEELVMTKLLTPPATIRTVADLLKDLGGIDPSRVRFPPSPGTATENDVIAIQDHEDRLYELVDGVLVEKVMGVLESLLAIVLGRFLETFAAEQDLGIVLGADGMLRLRPNLVRAPDVSFISWERIPGDEFPRDPIPDLVPDLAVEVISEGNTKKEMERKLHEYFEAGVRLVWFVYPKTRSVEVYTSPKKVRRLRNSQTLDGGEVLPGFTLPLPRLFDRAKRRRTRR